MYVIFWFEKDYMRDPQGFRAKSEGSPLRPLLDRQTGTSGRSLPFDRFFLITSVLDLQISVDKCLVNMIDTTF